MLQYWKAVEAEIMASAAADIQNTGTNSFSWLIYLLHCFSRRPPYTQCETLKVVCDHQPVSQRQLTGAE